MNKLAMAGLSMCECGHLSILATDSRPMRLQACLPIIVDMASSNVFVESIMHARA